MWTFGGADKFGFRHARLKVVVLQPTVISSFGCFVFEFWVLRFRDLGALCFDPHFLSASYSKLYRFYLLFSMQHYLLPFHPLTTNDTLHK